MAKTRNPQDTTLRNARAAAGRDQALRDAIVELANKMAKRIMACEARLDELDRFFEEMDGFFDRKPKRTRR